MQMQHHSLTQTLRSGCAIIQRLVIYAMTSLYFQESLYPSIYIVGAATGTSEPTLMGTVVLRLTDNNGNKHTFTTTCPSLQSIYSQQEFSANNLRMNMVLIGRVQESHRSLTITLSFGIMVNSARFSRHLLLAFRNVCLIQATLN